MRLLHQKKPQERCWLQILYFLAHLWQGGKEYRRKVIKLKKKSTILNSQRNHRGKVKHINKEVS